MLKVDIGWDFAVFKDKNTFDHSSHTSCAFQVSNIGFD